MFSQLVVKLFTLNITFTADSLACTVVRISLYVVYFAQNLVIFSEANAIDDQNNDKTVTQKLSL